MEVHDQQIMQIIGHTPSRYQSMCAKFQHVNQIRRLKQADSNNNDLTLSILAVLVGGAVLCAVEGGRAVGLRTGQVREDRQSRQVVDALRGRAADRHTRLQRRQRKLSLALVCDSSWGYQSHDLQRERETSFESHTVCSTQYVRMGLVHLK